LIVVCLLIGWGWLGFWWEWSMFVLWECWGSGEGSFVVPHIYPSCAWMPPNSGSIGIPAVLEKQQIYALNLSQHAENRIRSREIPWYAALQKRISFGNLISEQSEEGSPNAPEFSPDNRCLDCECESRVTRGPARDRSLLKERDFLPTLIAQY